MELFGSFNFKRGLYYVRFNGSAYCDLIWNKVEPVSNWQQSLWHLLFVYRSEVNLIVQSEPKLRKFRLIQ